MKKQSIHTVKIGNMLSTEVADASGSGIRMWWQWKAVMNYHKVIPSAWWCTSPFDWDDAQWYNPYIGHFYHTFFDGEGNLRTVRVPLFGKIKEVAPHLSRDGKYKRETDAVKEAYGLFHGN